MNHPFKVGEKYRNRRGDYEIVSLDGGNMTLRYADGDQITTTVEVQLRIWENIQLDEKISQLKKKTKKKKKRPSVKKSNFLGLQKSDFKKGITGTNWRARTALGGLVSREMSDSTKYNFLSWAIYRKAGIHIARADCYNEGNKEKCAKYILLLSDDRARCGFYIEKSDKEMDDNWDWVRFIAGMDKNGDLQDVIEKAMKKSNLHWEIYFGEEVELEAEITLSSEGLQWADKRTNKNTPVDWSEFIARIHAFPVSEWYNLHLCKYIPKKTAIAKKLDIVSDITEVYKALLPLYETSVPG